MFSNYEQGTIDYDISHIHHINYSIYSGMLFCKVFFDTMAREWHGIDRLRLDKYYMVHLLLY